MQIWVKLLGKKHNGETVMRWWNSRYTTSVEAVSVLFDANCSYLLRCMLCMNRTSHAIVMCNNANNCVTSLA